MATFWYRLINPGPPGKNTHPTSESSRHCYLCLSGPCFPRGYTSLGLAPSRSCKEEPNRDCYCEIFAGLLRGINVLSGNWKKIPAVLHHGVADQIEVFGA